MTFNKQIVKITKLFVDQAMVATFNLTLYSCIYKENTQQATSNTRQHGNSCI